MTAPPDEQGWMGEEEVAALGAVWVEFSAAYEARSVAFLANSGKCAPDVQGRVFGAERALLRLGNYGRLLATIDSLRTRALALEKVAVAARAARGWAWMDPADGRYDALKALDAALSELAGGK